MTRPSTPHANAAQLDDQRTAAVHSGHSVFNQIVPKAKHMSTVDAGRLGGSTPNAPTPAQLREAHAKRLAESRARFERREQATAKREAENAAKAAARTDAAADRAKRKEDTAQALRDAGLGYTGGMVTLRDAKKAYVRSTTGRLRSTDELAEIFDIVEPNSVIWLCLELLGMQGANPYRHQNVGQQSMNLRNKLRFAIRKGTVTLDAVRKCRDDNKLAWTAEEIAARHERQERARKARGG